MSDTPKDTPKSDPGRKNGGKGRPPEVTPGAPPAGAGSSPASAPAAPEAKAAPAKPADAARPMEATPPAATVPPKPRPESGTPSVPRPASAPPAPERHDRLALPVAVVSGIVALAALGITLADRGRVDLGRIDRLEQGQASLPALTGQVQALAGQTGQAGQRFAALETALREGAAAQNNQIQALRDQVAGQRSDREALQRAADARIEAAERSLSQRINGAESQLAQRIASAEAALGPRFAAVENAMQQRVAAVERESAERMAAAERASAERLAARDRELDARFAVLQQRESRLDVAERRLAVLVATTAADSALAAGRPLGRALANLPGEAPAALSRYASAAPPTEASLRLSFDDAARAARAQSQPSTEGQTVWESAAQRLGNLVTVRRGEDVVWGDAISGELEEARRALDAGDLPAAVQKVEALPGPVRSAMSGWLGEARGLLAARAALETLRAGGQG
ncbi:hypothetical protein [Teichococcus oryzae]|uniref:Uncharacterized protein n=1 Tax=Teichococcus oryzae TaxID=1608942 RepID=A0A5B2TF10_9PROT|nr:hypothetical protein [Pseudoroseomonas oryzae]KAA2213082.1 hypothetical protein F0Q34_10590 [Pseudoroseomonas oryzae]